MLADRFTLSQVQRKGLDQMQFKDENDVIKELEQLADRVAEGKLTSEQTNAIANVAEVALFAIQQKREVELRTLNAQEACSESSSCKRGDESQCL